MERFQLRWRWGLMWFAGLTLLSGCGGGTFSLKISNDSDDSFSTQAFSISSVRLWRESGGCPGPELLDSSVSAGSSVTVEPEVASDGETISVCVETSAGSNDPSLDAVRTDPGCQLDAIFRFQGGSVSYVIQRVDCPED